MPYGVTWKKILTLVGCQQNRLKICIASLPVIYEAICIDGGLLESRMAIVNPLDMLKILGTNRISHEGIYLLQILMEWSKSLPTRILTNGTHTIIGFSRLSDGSSEPFSST